GLLERTVEETTCRTDERPPGEIFGVARLLADEHQLCVAGPLAEHGLRAAPPEIARLAVLRRLAHRRECGAIGYQVSGRLRGFVRHSPRQRPGCVAARRSSPVAWRCRASPREAQRHSAPTARRSFACPMPAAAARRDRPTWPARRSTDTRPGRRRSHRRGTRRRSGAPPESRRAPRRSEMKSRATKG